jgi:hypothetical protein
VNNNRKRVTDEEFNAIFAAKHGNEELEYYAPEYRISSTWDAIEDHYLNRGGCGKRTEAHGGC